MEAIQCNEVLRRSVQTFSFEIQRPSVAVALAVLTFEVTSEGSYSAKILWVILQPFYAKFQSLFAGKIFLPHRLKVLV